MGIRIHKSLCYALTDVKYDKKNPWHIIDERFVDNINNEEMTEKPFDGKIFESFLQWIRDNPDKCRSLVAEANGDSLEEVFVDITITRVSKENCSGISDYSKMFTHQGEYGLPNVVGFSELFSPDWNRYDDTLDYYTESVKKKGSINYFNHLPCGIYPYLGMVRIPLPEIIALDPESKLPRKMMPVQYQMLTGKFSKKQPPLLGAEKANYVEKAYRPDIPDSILLYTHFMGFFKDWKKTVQELRPILYVYWS